MSNNRTIALVYSSHDNKIIEEGTKGWVTNFHKFLSTLLYQITRRNPEIKLINESKITDSVLEDYSIILSVVSENFVANTTMVHVLNDHVKKLKDERKLVYDGVARVFKILKRPFDSDDHLYELEDLLTYDFYLLDPITGDSQEFTRFFVSDAERSYWMKLIDMAYDINQVLRANQNQGRGKGKSYNAIPREKTVYLASTGVDMVIQRDIIKRELLRHGYKVLPDHSLPKEAKVLDEMVRKDLKQCRLSIHMVGEDYGDMLRSTELSVVDMQNKIASEHTYQMVNRNKSLSLEHKQLFSRLIWVSPDLKNITERQKIFIEDLKSDAARLEEAEVLQIQLQGLKTIIKEELVTGGRFSFRKDTRDAENQEEGYKTRIIYLIADKKDLLEIGELQQYLTSQGFDVVSPSYEGDLVDLRYLHQENLRRCDASIVYFGQVTEDWIKTKLQDFLKAPGFGRENPLEAKAVYCMGRKDIALAYYKKNNTMILGNNGEDFSPNHLKPFLTKIRK